MKKIIAIFLAVIMCLAIFAACDKKGNEETTTSGSGTSASTETPTESAGSESESESESVTDPTPDIEYDVEAAVANLNALYAKYKENNVTGADFTLVSQVRIANVPYTVDWASNNEKVKAIKGESDWTIDLEHKTAEEYSYTLTATVTAGDGTTATFTLNLVVPVYDVATFEEYMAAEKGTNMVVEGIVVAMNAKSVGNSRNHLFLADVDGKGGYYCYQLDMDPVAEGVKVGMTVAVTSVVEPYSGMQELKGGTFAIVDETIKSVDVLDITDKFASGADLKNYVGLPVTIKGVTIKNQVLGGSSDYLNFELNGKTAYVRSYVTDFPTTLTIVKGENGAVSSPDKTAIETAHAEKYGWTANATGILVLYSGAPYLIPMSVDCFEYLELVEKTPAEKIADEVKDLVVPGSISADTVLTLPLVGQYYSDVKFAWTVDNTAFTIGDDGKVEIKLGADAVTLKFTATITLGELTETKEYTVEVAPALVMSETLPYIPYIYQAKNGTALFLDGGVSGRYLTTTTDASKAVGVYAEKVAGGYKFYILVEGAKQYITIYNNSENKTSVNYDAAGNTVFTYNPTVNAYVTVFNDTEVYLGTYNNFDTISVSNLSYITAENTGVSQFPLELLVAVPDGSHTASLTQAKVDNKVLYLDGGVSGRYLTTTDDATKAVTVYAEKVADGYKFYIVVEGAKQYITIYNNDEGKLSVKYDAAGNSVFNYNATVNAWVAVFGGTEYYLGTYNTFETVSASKLSYITADNTGVEQFPLEYNFVEMAEIPVTPDNGEGSEGGEGTEGGATGGEAPAPTPSAGLEVGKGYTISAANANGLLYFDGTVSGGRFNGSSDASKAVTVYVENATNAGEYLLYFYVADTKTYVVMDDTSTGGSLVTDAASATAFEWNAEKNTLAVALDSNNRAFGAGASSTYNNFSCYDLTGSYNWGQFTAVDAE